MTRDEFWHLIESTRPKGAWAALHAGTLELALEKLPEDEIVSFDRHFQELMAESYRCDLWGAAYIANGGCSDDGFVYFRAWLISQGRRYFEKCLRAPDELASRASLDGDTEDEEFLYCAAEAYREKTGKEIAKLDDLAPAVLVGERWQEDELVDRYPKLAKKFGIIKR